MSQFTKEIFTPSIGEVLNVSAATNIYRVRLTDGLVNSLLFSKLDDYELARVSGRIHFQEDSTTPSLDTVEEVAPTSEMEHLQLHKKKMEPSIFVGDIRLTEFKRVLQAEGISAEFKDEGMLVCNDLVVVRKVREKDHGSTGTQRTELSLFVVYRPAPGSCWWKAFCLQITIELDRCCILNMPSYRSSSPSYIPLVYTHLCFFIYSLLLNLLLCNLCV